MDAYTIRDAAARFDDLVGRAEAGEEVEIARDGRVVARLVPAAVDASGKKKSFDWRGYRAWANKNLPLDPTDSVVEMRKQERH